ncbi:NAD(P)H-binding protein [Chromobacterium sp. ATCC 53434]|uniref:SDR family oxidoreductase n=1 Tax=Chromobacterium sp. (strain ATCC 53434 / SC 14030) TaxID=2059672 RepID=UPI000C76915D|nr:SDR family oxidoreductase [Chromobacterium sp. ATCC 53434]AUH51676.1 NAD(P)H-binding protein [Chromobacterium sp. ATCC 53434]
MRSRMFITGATGFLGGELAAQLIKSPQWDEALFLVRACSPAHGRLRLADTLLKHGVEFKLIPRLRLDQIICGDLNTAFEWGKDLHKLADQLDIINLAAVTSLSHQPSLWTSNVTAVVNMAGLLQGLCAVRRFIQVGIATSCGQQAISPVLESYDAREHTQHFLKYTASKYAAESQLRKKFPTLPLIAVRPSTIIGHSQHGCTTSGSMYWPFRIARALGCFPFKPQQAMDIVPVDYCAQALLFLSNKRKLADRIYHISSGLIDSCTFAEINASITQAVANSPVQNYQYKSTTEISKLQSQFPELLGACDTKLVMRAIRTYALFSLSGLTFSNQSLLDEGMPPPPPFSSYAGLCEITSQTSSIIEQMQHDYS